MVKVYYGNDYGEAMYNGPIYTNNASSVEGYKKCYNYVVVDSEITYEDIQEMDDETRLKLYKEETGETLRKIGDKFWDWVEENFEIN